MEDNDRKIISALIDENGYIISYLTVGELQDGIFIEVPEYIPIKEVQNYKYINNEFIKLDDSEIDILYAPAKIEKLKKNLNDSDYKVLKYMEGQLSFDEYEQVKQLRQSWREEINQLENILGDRF